jgi:hypothetical protein
MSTMSGVILFDGLKQTVIEITVGQYIIFIEQKFHAL